MQEAARLLLLDLQSKLLKLPNHMILEEEKLWDSKAVMRLMGQTTIFEQFLPNLRTLQHSFPAILAQSYQEANLFQSA